MELSPVDSASAEQCVAVADCVCVTLQRRILSIFSVQARSFATSRSVRIMKIFLFRHDFPSCVPLFEGFCGRETLKSEKVIATICIQKSALLPIYCQGSARAPTTPVQRLSGPQENGCKCLNMTLLLIQSAAQVLVILHVNRLPAEKRTVRKTSEVYHCLHAYFE